MDILRNALLVMLVAILAYVLYKRLVLFLNRDKINAADFAHVPGFKWKDGVLKVDLELPALQDVIIEVGEGNDFKTIKEEKLDSGIHNLEFPLEIGPGKKTCRITTQTNKIERYFQV